MKLFFSLYILFIWAGSVPAQDEWYWQNPVPPPAYDLNKVKCFDQNRWIVVGLKGLIYMTTNGGYTWGTTESGTDNDIVDLFFVNESRGVIITNNSILKTSDGGWTWDYLSPPAGDFLSCFMLDSVHIYIGGSKWSQFEPYGTVSVSSNGGTEWIQISQFGTGNYIRDINFISVNVGIAVSSDGKSYKSIDGGLTWDQTLSAETGFRSLSFCDSLNGIVVGGIIHHQQIYKTTDAGSTWEQTNTPYDYIKELVYYNYQTLIAVGSNYSVYKSFKVTNYV